MKKCINRRCNRDLQDDYIYCPYCGKNQSADKPKNRRRTKGTGSIYIRKDSKSKPYAAASSITGKQVYLGTFATKREAENALKDYEYNPVNGFNMTLEQLHDKWVKTKAYKKLGNSVKSNYASAYIKLKPLYKRKFRDLRTSDFQYIVDYYDSPHHEVGAEGKLKYLLPNGKGTYKVTDTPKICQGLGYSALHKVKCLLTTLYTFAMKEDILNKNYAAFIELPEQEETTATRFTEVQLELIKQNVGKVPYMDYIYIMCYVNFRVSEFLELTPDKYKVTDSGIHYFVGGKKTDAGKDRIVPIHPKIQQLVQNCINNNGETIFCRIHEGSEFGKAMNKDYFLKYAFRPAMQALGLGDEFTPHSCRRTFSTRMSAAGAREEDIIALMGHTDYKVDIDHYIIQEVDTLYNAIKLLA